MNINQELVKHGWCYCGAMRQGIQVLDGLKNEAREARKELWANLQPVSQWVLRKA